MKRINYALLSAAARVAKSTKARALFIFLDTLNEFPEVKLPPDCNLILVSRRTEEEMQNRFGEALKLAGEHRILSIPQVDMTRLGQIKVALLLAFSQDLLALGDRVVFVAGLPNRETLDAILFLDTSKESEVLAIQGLRDISDSINPEVFQTVLGIATELANRGREGKPVGTIFVLGDEDKVMPLSRQMIINPFRGYNDDEKNILNPALKETIREFSALDGAFVISSSGLVLAAGRYLGAASDESTIPRGLGSRHIAAAGITALTDAMAIVISESTGDIRIFKNGKIMMEIEKPNTPSSPQA